MRNRRLLFLMWVFVSGTPLLTAQTLQAFLEGDHVRVTAPQLPILTGKVLERLHNGAAVPFTIQLTASSGNRLLADASSRIVVSFDLWEERYSAVQDSPKRTASHLSSAALPEWLVESLSIPVAVLAAQKPFVLKLDIRAEEEQAIKAEPDPGFSMASLIDVFSRKGKDQPSRWTAVSGPLRLEDLRQKAPGGGRSNHVKAQPSQSHGSKM